MSKRLTNFITPAGVYMTTLDIKHYFFTQQEAYEKLRESKENSENFDK